MTKKNFKHFSSGHYLREISKVFLEIRDTCKTILSAHSCLFVCLVKRGPVNTPSGTYSQSVKPLKNFSWGFRAWCTQRDPFMKAVYDLN